MSAVRGRARTSGRTQPDNRDAVAVLTAAETAWLLALPCAAIVGLAVVLLGPPLGSRLFPSQPLTIWPSLSLNIRPEPTEQARYLLALCAPVLLTAALLVVRQRAPRLPPTVVTRLVVAVQAVGALTVVLCFVVQRRYTFTDAYTVSGSNSHTTYFTLRTTAIALALATALTVVLRRERLRTRLAAALAGESRGRRIGGALAAGSCVAAWLLTALHFDGTIGTAQLAVTYHVQFTFDEIYAVLDGRSPLVDFAAQYGSLWPYLVAAGMSVLGTSVGVLTLLTSAITGLAMLAAFATWRRVARSTLLGLLLFLPFLATSFYMMRGPLENRYALVNLPGAFPLRYAGPLLVLWLLARHLDGALPRRSWPVFALGGLALLNNADFGLAALGATVAALLFAQGQISRAVLLHTAKQLAIGLAFAFASVSAVMLLRTGSLPDPELLVRFSRLFALVGFAMLPMKPEVGIALLIFLTHVAAVGTAAVRAANDDHDRLLTGLLAWSGIFGLGAGAYYMGRSHPEVLINMFPAWALSVLLLTVVAVRSLASASRPQLPIPQFACFFAAGLAACSLAQIPTPWGQIDRLQRTTAAPIMKPPVGQNFVAAHTRPGEPVLIFMLMGHRMGHDLGIDNVSPYTGIASMPSLEQMQEALDALAAAGGNKLFYATVDRVSGQQTMLELPEILRQVGFRLGAKTEGGELRMWIADGR